MDDLPKLHIGCGPNILAGWLNVDLVKRPGVRLLLDASVSLPFQNESCRYIFSEHFIEHLDYRQASRFISESFRVLVCGGKIRLATPDLSFLIRLYHRDKTDLQKRYIQWVTETFLPDAPLAMDTFVINNFFRAWEHKFIHDEASLTLLLRTGGFIAVERFAPRDSRDEALRHLESHGRWISDEFNKLETFVLEATKPVPHSFESQTQKREKQ